MKRILIIAFLSLVALAPIAAQKFSVAYVDMQYILKNLPQYETANEQLNMISKRWQKEIDAAQQEVQILVSNYQTEQIFLSADMKKKQANDTVSTEGRLKKQAPDTVGTAENEIVSTLSIATSAIVTTLVIVAGVVLLVPLQPVLQNEALLPAFNNVVPALFGALGIKHFLKSPKIAAIPLLLMSALCIFVPSMINQTSILMIPSGALALGIGFYLFKKNKL